MNSISWFIISLINFIHKIISLKFNFIFSAQTNNMCRIDWCLEMSCISPQYWFFLHTCTVGLKACQALPDSVSLKFSLLWNFHRIFDFLEKENVIYLSDWLKTGKTPFLEYSVNH